MFIVSGFPSAALLWPEMPSIPEGYRPAPVFSMAVMPHVFECPEAVRTAMHPHVCSDACFMGWNCVNLAHLLLFNGCQHALTCPSV
jgi:hypothetical protein